MKFIEIKRDIIRSINDNITILKNIPFYRYGEEKIFALEEIKRFVNRIKTIEDLKTYKTKVLQISEDFKEEVEKAKSKSDKDISLGLQAGYKMGYIIIDTELENETLLSNQTPAPKKKSNPRTVSTSKSKK